MSFLGARPDSFQYGSTAYDHFSGDGVTTTFTLSRQVSANGDIQVVVNNVIQDPGVAYGVSNLNTLTFTGAPTAGTNNIYVVYRQFVQSGIAPGANTVTMSAIAANTIQPWQLSNSLLNPLVSTFTGDGSTVAFTLTQAAVSSNSCYVTVNGITQGSPANYSTNGATLTFTSAPAANSTIRVVQNSVVGTSIVPVDGSVTNTKLASNLTLTGSTILPIISGNTSITGSIKANNGLYSSNNFTGTYTDGIVMDYVTGNGRISVGGGDGLTFYNGGPATTALMTLTSGGSLGIGTNNPGSKLHITQNGDAISLENPSVRTFKFQTNGNNLNIYSDYAGSSSPLLYLAASSTGGNIGIGTTSPIRQLTVSAGSPSTEIAFVQTAAIANGKNWNIVVDGGNSGTTVSNFTLRILNDSGTGSSYNAGFAINGTTGLFTTGVARAISAASVPAGSIIQATWTDMGGGNASGTGSTPTATGFTNTFTPKFSNSKILHFITIGLYFICDGRFYIGRGGSTVSPSIGDSARTSFDYYNDWEPTTVTWIDSPGTTSSITYQLYACATGCGNTWAVGSSSDFEFSWTIMEIAQ